VILARDAIKTARRALELQLTDDLLALAKEFKGQPDKAALFFDQSRLEDPAESRATEAAKPARDRDNRNDSHIRISPLCARSARLCDG
jgi:hypothetical protein